MHHKSQYFIELSLIWEGEKPLLRHWKLVMSRMLNSVQLLNVLDVLKKALITNRLSCNGAPQIARKYLLALAPKCKTRYVKLASQNIIKNDEGLTVIQRRRFIQCTCQLKRLFVTIVLLYCEKVLNIINNWHFLANWLDDFLVPRLLSLQISADLFQISGSNFFL
jgi:hypothetical protein